MTANDLIKITFHKNEEGKYNCPVTFKEFTDFTHIVFNRVSGHVYSFDAIDDLNIRSKNWKDLITEQPFTRQDIITIQVLFYLIFNICK